MTSVIRSADAPTGGWLVQPAPGGDPQPNPADLTLRREKLQGKTIDTQIDPETPETQAANVIVCNNASMEELPRLRLSGDLEGD